MPEILDGKLIKVTNDDIKADGSFDIPSNVTSIGNSAFFNCATLLSVNIPNSVTSLKTMRSDIA